MNRIIVAMLILIIGVCGQAFADDLYVVNGLAETLSKVDLESNVVTNHIATLNLYPNDILIVRDTAYIVNSGSADIYMYDIIAGSIVRSIPIGSGRNPYRMAQIAPDTFVTTNWLTNSITKFTSTGSNIGEYSLSGSNPQGIAVRGDLAYITTVSFVWNDTSYSDGVVIVWDTRGDSVVQPIAVGNNPNDLTFSPDGKLYVVCTGDYSGTGMIYVVDTDLMIASDSIDTGGDPTDLAILPNGIGFVAAGGGWLPGTDGYVFTFDASTGNVHHGSTNPLVTDAFAYTVTLATDSTVFVMNFGDDTVTELDSAGTIIRRFLVGDGAQAGAIWKDMQCDYARGDADGSGSVDIDDVVYLIAYTFTSGPEPMCGTTAGDVDCSGEIDIDDVVYLIAYVFTGGSEPCPY